jgi:hypothetical protein
VAVDRSAPPLRRNPNDAAAIIFVRVHKTLRMSPAMAAGVTKRLWEISDVVDVLEAWEAKSFT